MDRASVTLFFCIFIMHTNVYSQSCNYDIKSSAPTSRYNILGDAAYDKATGLTWKRCPEGYQLNDNSTPTVYSDDTCEENQNYIIYPAKSTSIEPHLFIWKEGIQQAYFVNKFLGGYTGIDNIPHTDWRVPNIKELLTILEDQCNSPSYNMEVFPGEVEYLVSSTFGSWIYKYPSLPDRLIKRGNYFLNTKTGDYLSISGNFEDNFRGHIKLVR